VLTGAVGGVQHRRDRRQQQPAQANFDGGGYSFSQQALSTAGLAPGKTVQSVTLPAISHGVGDSLNALHIFAMGIGG
jgi:hypothetical protein